MSLSGRAPAIDLDFDNLCLRKSPNYAVWVAGCAGFLIAALLFWPRGDSQNSTEPASPDTNAHITSAVEVAPSAPAVAPTVPADLAVQEPASVLPKPSSALPKPAAVPAAPRKKAVEHTAKRRTRRVSAASSRARAKPGFLTLDARPYATVYVDGRRVGDTPIVDLALQPGEHRVRAVSADGTTRRFRVTLKSGDVIRRRVPSSP
jgi:serine/threonine-protein kinase